MWLNGLALVMFSAFVIFALLQAVFGWQVRNEELVQAGQPAASFWHYLGTGHFAEALFENWESEFLQMGSYVLLTAFLVQRGSPESKPLDGDDRAKDQPEHAGKDSPRLARTRGLPNVLYRNSLSIVLFAFFVLSFVGHVLGGKLPRPVLDVLKPADPASGRSEEFVIDLGEPTRMDRWAPRIAEWRQQGVKWTEISRRTNLKVANAYAAFKRFRDADRAA